MVKKKILENVGSEGNIIKAIYKTHTHSGEKLETILPKSGMRKCSLLPLPFSIVLEILARAIRQEKEIKVIQIGKDEDKQQCGRVLKQPAPVNSLSTHHQQIHRRGDDRLTSIHNPQREYLQTNLTKELKDSTMKNLGRERERARKLVELILGK